MAFLLCCTQCGDLRQMTPALKTAIARGRVFGVREGQFGFLLAQVRLEDNDQLYLYCLRKQYIPPNSHTMKVGFLFLLLFFEEYISNVFLFVRG